MITVAISGGFDPIHVGHVEMMMEAKALGDRLVVIINNDNWLKKMNVRVCDTGNAMTNKEIVDFSLIMDMQELRNYRKTVGRKTREIIKRFEPSDLKRKIEPNRLQRILDEGGVLNVEGANWLIDFWGRKNVAGILLMPVTRHHIVHINESIRLKEKCRKLSER